MSSYSHFHARSRDAIASLKQTITAAALAEDQLVAVGKELYAVRDLLTTEKSLFVLLVDESAPVESRENLTKKLFSSQISETSIKVLVTAISVPWSKQSDFSEGLTVAANYALFVSAEKSGTLQQVESELFQLANVVSETKGLESALSFRQVPLAQRREWFDRLLADKTLRVTRELVIGNLGQGELPADIFDHLSSEAAALRSSRVAHVVSAATLSNDQKEKIAEVLSASRKQNITVHNTVDPTILGGGVITIGDEVYDASVYGRLNKLRQKVKT